jgi:outer membrane receptor protein involved in Fe transport
VSLVDPQLATVPRVRAGGYSAISPWETGDGTTESLTHTFVGGVSSLRGRHNLKFGADFRIYRAFGDRFPQSVSPDLNFTNTYTRGPFDNSAAAPIGQELASMLLGIPDGSMVRSASFNIQDRYLGAYFHDDFQVTPRLTLNLGLRYEIEEPLTERDDRLVAGFAFDTPNPIEAAARANYAQNPIPELPVDAFQVRSGLTWEFVAGSPGWEKGGRDGVLSAAKRTISCRASAWLTSLPRGPSFAPATACTSTR